MAFPHPIGLQPSEVAFLCEMEQVTVLPRQRLDRIDLLGGTTKPLNPPQRTTLPLWLAILLKGQKRANILPPAWLHPTSLDEILELETKHFQDSFSPAPHLPPIQDTRRVDGTGQSFYATSPFLDENVVKIDRETGNMAASSALPYHWFEMAEMLLDAAADDLVEPDAVRRILRDIREVRLAKMRKGVEVLSGDGEGVRLDGVGAMEISESRGFITGVMDGLRRIGASKEQTRREREEEERENGRYAGYDDEDEDMT